MPLDLDKIKDIEVREKISKMFEHYDIAEMTDKRKAWVKAKFVTPGDFESLRIVLGIISDEEAGLFIRRDEDSIQEVERYEFEDRIRKGIKNVIKNVILNLYLLTKKDIQEEAIKNVLVEQEKDVELEKLKAETAEKTVLEEKGSGVNT